MSAYTYNRLIQPSDADAHGVVGRLDTTEFIDLRSLIDSDPQEFVRLKAELVKFYARVFNGARENFGVKERWNEASAEALFDQRMGLFGTTLVVREAGEIIAAFLIEAAPHPSGVSIAYEMDVIVDPAARRHGLGSVMTHAGLTMMADKCIKKTGSKLAYIVAETYTRSGGPADFWARKGFVGSGLSLVPYDAITREPITGYQIFPLQAKHLEPLRAFLLSDSLKATSFGPWDPSQTGKFIDTTLRKYLTQPSSTAPATMFVGLDGQGKVASYFSSRPVIRAIDDSGEMGAKNALSAMVCIIDGPGGARFPHLRDAGPLVSAHIHEARDAAVRNAGLHRINSTDIVGIEFSKGCDPTFFVERGCFSPDRENPDYAFKAIYAPPLEVLQRLERGIINHPPTRDPGAAAGSGGSGLVAISGQSEISRSGGRRSSDRERARALQFAFAS